MATRQGMTRPSDGMPQPRDRFDRAGDRISGLSKDLASREVETWPGSRATRRDETSGEETSARTTHSSRAAVITQPVGCCAPGAKQRTTR